MEDGAHVVKFCECGCGQPLSPSRRSTPSRFRRGHNGTANLTNHTVSAKMLARAREAFAKNPVMKRGVGHISARTWQLRSPANTTHRFRNLAEFIRQNPGLFAPEDVQWKRNPKTGTEQCRAFCGLALISIRRKEPRGSWKGWTWFSQVEKLHNNGGDLLDRQFNAKR